MPDIFLYPGEATPSDIVLRDPTTTGGSFVVYTHTGSGTITFSGVAALVKSKASVATGSLLFNGTAPLAKRKAFQPTGSIIFSGSSLVKKIKVAMGAGSLLFTGTAPKDFIPGPPPGGTRAWRIGTKWHRNQN